jgi:predicted transcriptional regulator of viral defense system
MRYKARMTVQGGKEFVKGILGQGRYSFTLDEAANATGLDGQALNMALQRLKNDGWVVPFSQGFYLALDLQHQATGMLDPEWFVDDWAKFLGVGYYVGGLSAAAIHGAAHQRPLAFQVFMPRNMRAVSKGGVHVEAFYKRVIRDDSVERRKSPAGYFRVSTPELTAYDLLAYARCCPSLDLAATVFSELGESIDSLRLQQLPAEAAMTAVLQRVGWLLDRTGWSEKTEGLHEALGSLRQVWRPFDSRLPRDGNRNGRWKIIENADVQPDVEL